MPVETRSSGRRSRRAAMAPDTADALPGLTAQARMFLLDEGLYAVNLGPETASDATGGVALPAFLVSTPPSDEYDLVEIVASSGDVAGWFGAQGGTVVLKAPPGGGIVLLTSYGASEGAAEVPVDVRRLDRPRETQAAAAARPLSAPPPSTPASEFPAAGLMPAAAPAADWGERELSSEIVLHIEREGDRRFAAPGWVGNRGRRLRIEAFSIRPLEGLSPGDIEYKAYGPNGRETPWVTDAKLCGTRGRGLPLTGFAVRLTPNLRDQFDVVYEGSFFDSGVAGPQRNGEPCMPAVFNDPLEAIHLRLVERRQQG